MVTTIQLNEKVKKALDRLKNPKETYEDVIVSLMNNADKQEKEQERLLIEGCNEMAEDMIKTCKEWESTDSDIDWEWNENAN